MSPDNEVPLRNPLTLTRMFETFEAGLLRGKLFHPIQLCVSW
jgi:hypothetical protein